MGIDQLAIQKTDDLVGVLPWSEASDEVARWLESPGPFIIEGVVIPRAMRKWLAAHPDGVPFDRWYLLEEAWLPQTPGQMTMGKGIATVLREVRATCLARGIDIDSMRAYDHDRP
jgi:hypothetical protein